MTSARDVIADWIADVACPLGFEHETGKSDFSYSDAILAALDAAGYAVVPKEDVADSASAWVMHDNHTFTRLTARSVQGLVTEALRVHSEHRDCMLCPVTVLKGKKELRRVGPSVHLYSKDFAKDLSEWIAQVSADPDITRLLTAAKETT